MQVSEAATQPAEQDEQSAVQAFVDIAKTPGHYGFNTPPMDRDAAIDYANEAAKEGLAARVFRAAPVTPGLTSRELLERHESFVTSDLLATFIAVDPEETVS